MDENQELEQVEHSKITINGQEYDASEVQSLMDVGRKTKEYEQKWNTPLDTVWPEYGKTREMNKSQETKIAELQSKLDAFQQKQDVGAETQYDTQQAKEAARKLGILLQEDAEKAGYVKKDDLQNWYREQRERERATEAVLSEADKLSSEMDGSDGRPKFNKEAVLAYAQTYGQTYNLKSLMDAYERMNADSLKAWKDAQVETAKKPGLKTLKATPGNKQPEEKKITKDNFDDALKETLWGGKE